MTDEGLIDTDESLRRVTGAQLAQLMFPRFDEKAERTLLATGMNASPGAAVGKAVFDSDTAVEWAERGEDVILVRKETNPDDLRGMVAARGILTSRGGKTSHAAVVARGMGRTCVCGVEALDVNAKKKRAKVRGGDADPRGRRHLDRRHHRRGVPRRRAGHRLRGDALPRGRARRGRPGDRAVDRVMRHADGVRRLRVRANADTPEDAARARRFGAEGIGLCRTEHMFLGERRQLVENLIVAEDEAGQEAALAELLPLQRDDFRGILEAMDGLPVTIRLIDPPLHEFLPDYTELSVKVALEDEADIEDEHDQRLLEAVKRLHEQNPMLGLRGVRLGIVIPGLFKMQVRAILEAAAERIAAGGDPQPEIMIPLVAAVTELDLVKGQIARGGARRVEQERGMSVPHKVGTMIELPRAAVTANEIARSAEFFSFGTNDLTQMTWGFSRDDVESSFFSRYLEHGIFQVSPFESLDVDGVGRLVRHAARLGRQANPDLHLGVCGEHGGDPASIHFFDATGLDYVSCSPFRVPVARLEAGRSALGAKSDATA